MHTILSSASKTVRIGDDQPFAIIGERINPTGRKIFQLQLRNGPCGGVRPDGSCEVKPEMRCVWLKGYDRSRKLPLWRSHFNELRPPLDNSLHGTSSWKNLVTGRDKQTPPGWNVAS